MIIELQNISKRYNSHWILKKLNYRFDQNEVYGVCGNNGSGKSTLLKILSGYLSPSLGEIIYSENDIRYHRDEIYKYISFSAPYISAFKSLKILEMLSYMQTFKAFAHNKNPEEVLGLLELSVNKHAFIGELSSGQLQRFNLGCSILQDSKVLLLDEPGSFLDLDSKEWFHRLFTKHLHDRLCIVASNDEADLVHCTRRIQLS